MELIRVHSDDYEGCIGYIRASATLRHHPSHNAAATTVLLLLPKVFLTLNPKVTSTTNIGSKKYKNIELEK
jgi:hypothetical protein